MSTSINYTLGPAVKGNCTILNKPVQRFHNSTGEIVSTELGMHTEEIRGITTRNLYGKPIPVIVPANRLTYNGNIGVYSFEFLYYVVIKLKTSGISPV